MWGSRDELVASSLTSYRTDAVGRNVDDERKKVQLREATVKILDGQIRAVNQRREDEVAARRQEIQGRSL